MFFGRTGAETVSKPVFFKKAVFHEQKRIEKKRIRICFFCDSSLYSAEKRRWNPTFSTVHCSVLTFWCAYFRTLLYSKEGGHRWGAYLKILLANFNPCPSSGHVGCEC